MKKFTRIAAIVGVLAAPLVFGAAPASAATPTVSGTVACSNGQAVQGVWVQSSAGGSKFASWYRFPGLSTTAYYSASLSFSASSSSIELRVGCGGSSSSWWATVDTPGTTVSGSRTLNATCSSPSATKYVNGNKCSFPPKGQTVTYNQGIAGYCTWGAYEKWKASTGYYPNIGGNAKDMDERAAARGWRVKREPHKRAMVVFNSGGGGYGHVGWVTGIRKDSSGRILVDYVDMNGGTYIQGTDAKTTDFNRFVNRTKVWTSSADWRFIVATA